MTQYIAVYYPHDGTHQAEANGPYRSEERAKAEVERLQKLEDEHDPFYGWVPHVVELGKPIRFELHEAFTTEES